MEATHDVDWPPRTGTARRRCRTRATALPGCTRLRDWLVASARDWVRVKRHSRDLPSEDRASVCECDSLGVRRGYRCDVPGVAIVGREHCRALGTEAMGVAAVHRRGCRRQPLLFSPRL